jgi:hypothetical protein
MRLPLAPGLIAMQNWLTRLRRHFQSVLSLRSETPRLPSDALEAGRVFRRRDGLNGRYYFEADVVLDDGTLLREMTFDGDTNIAVLFGGRWDYLPPSLFGRQIVGWLVTKDCTGGGRYGDATPEQREAFARVHGEGSASTS